MFNKTDATKSSDVENRKSTITSQKLTDSVVQLPTLTNNEQTGTISRLNQIFANFKRLSLSTKATVLAIAIGTLPVLGIGVLAYQISKQSIENKVSQLQQSQTEDLADKINRFMVERYGDIQFISNLPILINSQTRVNTSPKKNKQYWTKS